MGLKRSSLLNKVLKNRSETEDKRGKHGSHLKKMCKLVKEDMKTFIFSLPNHDYHYSKIKNIRYIAPEFGSIANIYKVFIDIYIEYKKEVSYQMFRKFFNSCKIKIKKPRSDLCETCDELELKISKAKRENSSVNFINQLEKKLKEHKFEANSFYELKEKIKQENKNNKNIGVICYDFQKNLQIPKTNVNLEYYLSKFHLHNFGVHNLLSNCVSMYLYPENFGRKTPNEVISFLNYYILNTVNKNVKSLVIFSDNAFSQNKNRFLWAYYYYLTITGKFNEIIINYPIPGHSLMEIDGDFGRIEKLIRKREKIFMPSEYARIIEITNSRNPFKVIQVNHSFSYSNTFNRPIVEVLDYKKVLTPILRQSLNHCSKIRSIQINNSGIKGSLKLNEICDIEILLFKKKFGINDLKSAFSDVPKAYESILPIKREKFLDIQLLLKHVQIPPGEKFYEILFSTEVAVTSKTKALIRNYIDDYDLEPNVNRTKK
jgi:hypothetical protein